VERGRDRGIERVRNRARVKERDRGEEGREIMIRRRQDRRKD
jgi:hypothetical protein